LKSCAILSATSSHGLSDARLAEDQLYRLYHTGWMATKFTRPQPTWLSCMWGAMLQTFHKLQSKPYAIPEQKSALQQIWDHLPQTTINKAINDFHKRLNTCTSAGGGQFEHMIW